MPEIPRDINFNFGIETIVDANSGAPVGLPESGGYVPGDEPIREHLAEVLKPATIEQSIVDGLKPATTTRDLLNPTKFRTAHNDAAGRISAALKEDIDAESAEKLMKLASLMNEKGDLTDLLTQLRQLLQQA